MKYEIKVTFESNRALTALESDELLDSLALQVEEPVTSGGDNVTYETKDIVLLINNLVYSCGDCGNDFEQQEGKIFRDGFGFISFACIVCYERDL